MQEIGFDTVVPFSYESLNAVVCSNKKELFVVFRGTDDARDWIVNGDLRRRVLPQGSVHRGFHDAVSRLHKTLVDEVQRQGGGDKTFYVAGHSLGGAMAALFSYQCACNAMKSPAIDGVFTFGQPLPFGRATASEMNSYFGDVYLRFVNERDVVTRLLPTYRHAGTRVHFDDDTFSVYGPTVSIKSNSDNTEKQTAPDSEAMSMEEFDLLRRKLEVEKRVLRA